MIDFDLPVASTSGGRVRAATNAAQLTAYLTNTAPPDGLGDLVGGDIIQLSANATYQGHFTLPKIASANGSAWLTLRTANYGSGAWPAQGYQVDSGDASLMATLKSQTADETTPVLDCADGAHHWQIYGIRFLYAAAADYSHIPHGGLFMIGRPTLASSVSPTTDADLEFCHDFTLRHCLFEGDPTYKGGFGLKVDNCDDLNVYDCLIHQLDHPIGEYQALVIASGHRQLYQNCTISGSCETVFIGGGVRYPVMASNAIAKAKWQPDTITFRYCHILKPDASYFKSPAWGEQSGSDLVVDATDRTKVSSASYSFQAGDVGKHIFSKALDPYNYVKFPITAVSGGKATLDSGTFFSTSQTIGAWAMGRYWFHKNLVESKTSSNVTLDGCLIENFYMCEQFKALALTPADQTADNDNADPWCTVENFTIQNCIFRHLYALMSFKGLYMLGVPAFGWDKIMVKGNGFTFTNNVCYDIDSNKYSGGGGFLTGTTIEGGSFDNVTIQHNTFWHGSSSNVIYNFMDISETGTPSVITDNPNCSNFIWRDNIVPEGAFYSHGPYCSSAPPTLAADLWTGALCASDWGGTPDWTCTYNCLAGASSSEFFSAGSPVDNKWPPRGSTYHNLGSDDGYSLAAMTSTYFTAAGTGDSADFTVLSTLATAAHDGTMIGADWPAISAKIALIR